MIWALPGLRFVKISVERLLIRGWIMHKFIALIGIIVIGSIFLAVSMVDPDFLLVVYQ